MKFSWAWHSSTPLVSSPNKKTSCIYIFSWLSMLIRTYLDWNHNTSRAMKVDKSGNPVYRIKVDRSRVKRGVLEQWLPLMSEGEPTPKVPFKESPDTKSWSADTEVPTKKTKLRQRRKKLWPRKNERKKLWPQFLNFVNAGTAGTMWEGCQ